MRRAGTVMVAAAALIALAGCGTGLPDSGQAGAGRDVGDLSSEPLRVAPAGPRPSAEPAEIVGGFLHAGAAFDDDHTVAKQFLDGPALSSWRPAQGTVVYPEDQSLTVTTRGTGTTRDVVVSAPVWATVDGDGLLSPAPPKTTASATFEVRRLGQVWRIERLEGDFGLWMPRYEFARAYTPLRLSFIDPVNHELVPDLRWVAGSRSSLATSLVRGLLAGPPEYLGQAVTSGFPIGTTLGVDAVPTTGGVAQVDLSPAALGATTSQRQQLFAQLANTLQQLPTVTSVQVTSGGAPYPIAGVQPGGDGSRFGYVDEVPVKGPPLVLSQGTLRSLDDRTGSLAPAAQLRQAQRYADRGRVSDLRSIAAGGQGELAGVVASGRQLYGLPASAPRELLLSGGDLVDPSVDPTSWVWTADRAVRGQLLVVPSSSSSPAAVGSTSPMRPLSPTWLTGRRVQAVDVSRDGSRLAVLSAAADGSTRLDVAGVLRDATGRPTGLSTGRPVAQSLAVISDVSWVDRTRLVVLGGRAGQHQPYQVEVGGLVSALPPVGGAVGVVGGAGVSSVFLTTDSGRVLMRVGNGWRQVGRGIAATIPT